VQQLVKSVSIRANAWLMQRNFQIDPFALAMIFRPRSVNYLYL
jgi:hypothetical protein